MKVDCGLCGVKAGAIARQLSGGACGLLVARILPPRASDQRRYGFLERGRFDFSAKSDASTGEHSI